LPWSALPHACPGPFSWRWCSCRRPFWRLFWRSESVANGRRKRSWAGSTGRLSESGRLSTWDGDREARSRLKGGLETHGEAAVPQGAPSRHPHPRRPPDRSAATSSPRYPLPRLASVARDSNSSSTQAPSGFNRSASRPPTSQYGPMPTSRPRRERPAWPITRPLRPLQRAATALPSSRRPVQHRPAAGGAEAAPLARPIEVRHTRDRPGGLDPRRHPRSPVHVQRGRFVLVRLLAGNAPRGLIRSPNRHRIATSPKGWVAPDDTIGLTDHCWPWWTEGSSGRPEPSLIRQKEIICADPQRTQPRCALCHCPGRGAGSNRAFLASRRRRLRRAPQTRRRLKWSG